MVGTAYYNFIIIVVGQANCELWESCKSAVLYFLMRSGAKQAFDSLLSRIFDGRKKGVFLNLYDCFPIAHELSKQAV